MTPDSGFYGLLDPAGQLRREQFPALPQPQQAGAPLWLAAWTAAGQDACCHAQGHRSLAFQGELYNLPALRAQLDAAADLPLARLLLLAHERWSLDFVLRLDGLFALALREGDTLHLYRDGSGARNLYYATQAGGRLAFATHLDTLLRLPGTAKRLARRSLHEYLRFLDIAAPNTPYEEVYALEAGQLLTCAAGARHLRHPHAGGAAQRPPASFDAAVDALDGLLSRSVETRLHDLHRPAAFLSGGVDSALICAIAARANARTTAVTVGFEGARYDETPIARDVAGHLGMAHQVLRFRRQDYLAAFAAFHRQSEQPTADPAAPATLLAFEYCRERFDAVLDGSGADESCGMPPPRHVRVAVEYAALLPTRLRRSVASLAGHLPGLAGYAPIFDFEHPAETLIRWHGFTRPEIEALCGEPVGFAHTRFFRAFAEFPRHAHFARSSALLDAMPGDRLHQASAMAGLALRYPFWDRGVDAFIRGLPPDYRYRPAAPKRILRALLARHVPQALWDVPKHGFDFPLREFLSAEDFRLVRHHLRREPWQRWQLLAPDRVEDYGRRFMAGDGRLMFRVWALVVLAAWLERHFD